MNLELKSALGQLAARVNAFVDGALIFTLLHRHDIRVGIACAMHIRSHWCVSTSLRLEILCVLHLCYWRWSTKILLEEMGKRVDAYAAAQPLARGRILKEVWDIMEAAMADQQVASWTSRKEVQLMSRSEVKQVRRLCESGFRAYHAYMNPSSRRTGSTEFYILLDSVRDGSLGRFCEQLATQLQGPTSYTAVSGALRKSGVALWEKSREYNSIRLAGVQGVDRC